MGDQDKQVYASIDLELTGFDPTTDEIIEVGFTKFTLSASGAEIISSWQSVFKPSKTVRHKILGLTGILESELETAPQFSEHRDFIQKEIQDTILVGHGLTLDIRFLEANGIRVPNQSIDTLDLAQWILPTYHSYNLESLMHLFSIKHLEAHRALADCQAVIALLVKLFSIYQTFSHELKNQITHLIQEQIFSWQSLLTVPFTPTSYPEMKQSVTTATQDTPITIADNALIHLPLNTQFSDAALANAIVDKQTLLALPNKAAVIHLWKEGFADPKFSEEDVFDVQKFNALCRGDLSSAELVKFLLKVSVWKEMNWQHYSVLDLNLSFFGGQFKALITGFQEPPQSTGGLTAVDHRTFLKSEIKWREKRLVVRDLLAFEDAASASFGSRFSWGGFLSRLRSIYNPETEVGVLDLRDKVLAALAATDLFFSLVVMELNRRFKGQETVSLADLEDLYPVSFNKLKLAASHLRQKLQHFLPQQPGLQVGFDSLESFFESDPYEVKWIEFGQKHAVFIAEPLEFSTRIAKLAGRFDFVGIIESIHSRQLRDYLVERLGLQSLQKDTGDLEADLRIPIIGVKEIDWSEELLPAVMLFPTTEQVKAYYDEHYRQLKILGSVYAEKYSGGANKLLHNFGIRRNSVLLVSLGGLAKMANIQIRAKTLIVAGLPEKLDHPYNQALRNFWKERFPDFSDIETAKLFQRSLEHIDVRSLEQSLMLAPDASQAAAIANLLTKFGFTQNQ